MPTIADYPHRPWSTGFDLGFGPFLPVIRYGSPRDVQPVGRRVDPPTSRVQPPNRRI